MDNEKKETVVAQKEKKPNNKIIILCLVIVAVIAIIVGCVLAFGGKGDSKTSGGDSSKGQKEEENLSISISAVENEVINAPILPALSDTSFEAPAGVLTSNGNTKTISQIGGNPNKPGQNIKYTFYILNTGNEKAYLKSITYGNVLGNTVAKECSLSEEEKAICDEITLTVKVDNLTVDKTTDDIKDAAIDSGKYQKVEVTVEYPTSAKPSSSDFKVYFGNIDFSYSKDK